MGREEEEGGAVDEILEPGEDVVEAPVEGLETTEVETGDLEAADVDEGSALEPVGEEGEAEVARSDDARERIERIVESVLFAAGAPVALRKLVDILGASGARPTVKEVQAAVGALQQRYVTDQRGIRLHDVAGGYQFRTARENAEWVRQLFREKPARLGRATLETLAIVAYKQPVTKAEIEAIRGVDVDGVLTTLLGRKLIKIAGRKEAVGRPLLYATTPEFLETFGLKDLNELPALHELGPITDGEDPASQPSEASLAQAAAADGTSESAADAGAGSDELRAEPAEGAGEFAAAAGADTDEAGAEAGAGIGEPTAEAPTGGDEWPADPSAAAEAEPAEPAAEWAAADGAAAEDPQPGRGRVATGSGDDDHGGAGPGERADGDGTGGEGGPPPRPNHG